ncbi:serine protease inhibitor dipetalogastin [Acrasis kona]|uniref:Serine protease inhibitor dipetalogastin n=1 Tax=Acrasis kona TaxID=1008807 RepID=A0AAW2YSN5_9EUKA
MQTLTIVLTIALISVASAKVCFCPQVYLPVCHVKTGEILYSNECFAQCYHDNMNEIIPCHLFKKVNKPTQEPVKDECICSQEFNPVCHKTTGKQLYSNECFARCHHENMNELVLCSDYIKSSKNDDCVCTFIFEPLCNDKDQIMFGNECLARCAKVNLKTLHKC